MPQPITTTGTTPTVSTYHQNGEGVRDWVARHNSGVLAATPSNKLETAWTAAQGPQKVESHRLPGETDAEFLERHVEAYLLVMIEAPPSPG